MEKSDTQQCGDWRRAVGDDLLGGEYTVNKRSCKIPVLQTQQCTSTVQKVGGPGLRKAVVPFPVLSSTGADRRGRMANAHTQAIGLQA